ncbi:proclotting enzyme [Nephila pilipes]|uniref:CLIP domain-containing serine protease n=1 Tax=Nephila pilipes TaxID=299642 RepID=A0A8X6MA19_NEPPI|nr:proclotting enzyme [Nephila pilipes]
MFSKSATEYHFQGRELKQCFLFESQFSSHCLDLRQSKVLEKILFHLLPEVMQFLLLGCVLCFNVIDSTTTTRTANQRITRNIVFPQQTDKRDSCTTPSERTGNCIPVLQCRQLVEARNMDLMRKSICGFEGKAPRVCCPMREADDAWTPETDDPVLDLGRGFTQPSTNVISHSDIIPNTRTTLPTTPFNGSAKDGRRRKTIFPSECGRSFATFRRIVGGQESVVGAWPWMALIYYIRRTGKSAECGGALITTKHIITAAHCIVSSRRGRTMSPRQLMVRLGEHDIESGNDGATPVDFAVRFVIKFDSFDFRTFQNDIAILVLNSTVKFGRHIAPICLPFDVFKGENLTNKNAFTAGWGTLSYGGAASTKLREIQIRIWENSQCKAVFRREVPITAANICAGDGDKDACRGDSGGPLMMAHTDGKFYLVGIVSFGKKCAEPGVPGVYCRISNFLEWIEQQVENTM